MNIWGGILGCINRGCNFSGWSRVGRSVGSGFGAWSRWTAAAFSTRNIRGRLFYRKRPLQLPRLKVKNIRSKWLEGAPQKRGICVKVFVSTPRKPNSGLRKLARVRLSTGRTVLVGIPGQGHNLNVHSVVLVRGGRTKDVTGCNYKAVRGAYDLLPVKNRCSSRSKYAVKLTPAQREARALARSHVYLPTPDDREYFNRVSWATWEDADGVPRVSPLGEDEPVPVDNYYFNRWYRRKMARDG